MKFRVMATMGDMGDVISEEEFDDLKLAKAEVLELIDTYMDDEDGGFQVSIDTCEEE